MDANVTVTEVADRRCRDQYMLLSALRMVLYPDHYRVVWEPVPHLPGASATLLKLQHVGLIPCHIAVLILRLTNAITSDVHMLKTCPLKLDSNGHMYCRTVYSICAHACIWC